LQTQNQRLILDTIAQVRKCGLQGIVALPQLVVCGDQSAGKSSVLEALTGIPFPRTDELCTRFATEIIIRRSTVDSLTITIVPDLERPRTEKASMESFAETITDFVELPRIMSTAMTTMGIGSVGAKASAFAKDVLRVELEGPSRPQLTLVDLPGLVQNETKEITRKDVDMAQEITDRYISQARTIVLAVISATNDYANQAILTKARAADPEGSRTLGIITKPDRLPAGSGSESAYISLARNEDIFLKLGWHVVKNRSFEEGASSFSERNASEASYFRHSSFNCLSKDSVGIDSLRERLSKLLFQHVKQELPKLDIDLREALKDAMDQLRMLGDRRSTSEECRDYLMQLSLEFHKVCAAAVKGQYEGTYFRYHADSVFTPRSPSAIRRLRAMIQHMNAEFSTKLRKTGHTYFIERSGEIGADGLALDIPLPSSNLEKPVKLSHAESLRWVMKTVIRNRGRELQGNFNPLVIGELFWEQSARWETIATDHVREVTDVCHQFLLDLLRDLCPSDVETRLSTSQIEPAVVSRADSAAKELERILFDLKEHPINYNHYYTDTVEKCRTNREREIFAACIESAKTHTTIPKRDSSRISVDIDIDRLCEELSQSRVPDMDIYSCEVALDGLLAIYKVSGKSRNVFSP
jgi:GTPase SAR1 family protein